ncbi:MAG: ATP-binding cassette domain-containing protein, partial [Clostridia bacterium]|nr:ATP-binding cassette domain-containing protein [Clostridia bacterium]
DSRNIVRATTAKSAQSRVKQLERMELLEKPYVPLKSPSFIFSYDTKPYEDVLKLNGTDIEIGGKRLISGVNLTVKRGERVALVGENGTGKSTLLKAIAKGNDNRIEVGRYVKLALYDQEGANLNGKNTVLAELWERHVGFTQTEVRSALARCGLYEEDMAKPVGALSGGERAKLALCILESEKGNVLLLDEPTNHLDLPARESLEKALNAFEGTVIFVSHDRYFLSALAQRTVEIEDGKLNVFETGYEEYTELKRKERDEKAKAKADEKAAVRQAEKETSYRSKKERAEEARLKELIKRTEKKIEELEGEESSLNSMLSDVEIASDYKKVNEIIAKLEGIKLQLDKLYKDYESMI